jgi:hypothetical protein
MQPLTQLDLGGAKLASLAIKHVEATLDPL